MDDQAMFFFYNIAATLLFFVFGPLVFLFLVIKGFVDQHFTERFGLLPAQLIGPKASGLRVWLHAVSIGEVKLAKTIAEQIQARESNVSLILSTTTKSGRQTALRVMPPDTTIIYNPIDLLWCVRSALKKVLPHLFINLETEIWPNLLWTCRRLGIPVFLVNGRISVRSINNYKRVRFFMRDVLSAYWSLSMISSMDAQRILSLGADPRRVVVGGNAKYDTLGKEAGPELSRRIAAIYRVTGKRPVFIAGSTRGGEEEIIIEAYRELRARYSSLVLIIAPRHIERCGSIETVLRSSHLDYCLRSDLEGFTGRDLPADIVLVNTFGELFGLYSIGTVVFCGASLVPLGGQNPLEAAVWGKPVLYGPSMEDFLEAKALLEGVGAGFVVRDKDEVVEKAAWLLDHQEESEILGRRAREEIECNKGSAKKQVERVFRIFHEGL
ncbi:MAG: 3-deoxy-D-manno-octulosonic acid transferase [Deltaproteobacteria bacterium]|nr:3-deoxy-D-manno-octulosonic acid transferase [Deltaproteobacteria bacterium]MBW2076074.1 3-deoxy-D-manno-octulosonic acid transferase [Deltaproteobacteria bacterium]